jgi:hypothetical protein
MLVMSQPITRIYDNESLALDVVSELKKNGFASDSIHVVAASRVKASDSDDGVVAEVANVGVTKDAAAAYADGVRKGQVVVSVNPNFGTARRATAILDKFNPIATPVSEAGSNTAKEQTLAEATPLSSRLNWSVLMNDPTPLSTKWNWPVLSDKATPLSDKLGASVLSDNATPFSSWLNVRVLSDDATPFSNWLKRPVLSDNPTPFSSWLNVRVLSDDPAPLSNWLHWPTKS